MSGVTGSSEFNSEGAEVRLNSDNTTEGKISSEMSDGFRVEGVSGQVGEGDSVVRAA